MTQANLGPMTGHITRAIDRVRFRTPQAQELLNEGNSLGFTIVEDARPTLSIEVTHLSRD